MRFCAGAKDATLRFALRAWLNTRPSAESEECIDLSIARRNEQSALSFNCPARRSPSTFTSGDAHLEARPPRHAHDHRCDSFARWVTAVLREFVTGKKFPVSPQAATALKLLTSIAIAPTKPNGTTSCSGIDCSLASRRARRPIINGLPAKYLAFAERRPLSHGRSSNRPSSSKIGANIGVAWANAHDARHRPRLECTCSATGQEPRSTSARPQISVAA